MRFFSAYTFYIALSFLNHVNTLSILKKIFFCFFERRVSDYRPQVWQ